jgi:elongation factor Ts
VAKNDEFMSAGNKIAEIAFENQPATIEDLLGPAITIDLTVADKLTELIGKIGEKIEVKYYERLSGEVVVPYIHAGSKLGVLGCLIGECQWCRRCGGGQRRGDADRCYASVWP